jgi:copper chaperone CopZ
MDETEDPIDKTLRVPGGTSKNVEENGATPPAAAPDEARTHVKADPTSRFEADLTLHGMHCDSCGKIIERTVQKFEGARIQEFDTVNNRIILACSSGDQLGEIRGALLAKGYQTLLPGEEAQEGFEAGSIHRGIDFIKSVYTGTNGFETENTLVKYSTDALFIVLAVQALLYIFIFSRNPGFLSAYWSVTILTAVSVVALLFAYYHAYAFRKSFSCMCGMMTGMTFGMAGGFLIGAFVGATNGMFVGSLVGMAVGMALGYYTGRYCGVMGVMEGIMGGLMAGTMGAMLSVMMVFDHLVPFLLILTAIEGALLIAFSYMLYKEHGNMTPAMVKMDGISFIILALAIDLTLTVIFIYGPKAGTVLGGF